MLHALSVDTGITVDKFNSSAEVSNFETLDIRHYLIGEATQAAVRAKTDTSRLTTARPSECFSALLANGTE